MAAPLASLHVTLVCRGTPVGNYWLKVSQANYTSKKLISLRLSDFDVQFYVFLDKKIV